MQGRVEYEECQQKPPVVLPVYVDNLPTKLLLFLPMVALTREMFSPETVEKNVTVFEDMRKATVSAAVSVLAVQAISRERLLTGGAWLCLPCFFV